MAFPRGEADRSWRSDILDMKKDKLPHELARRYVGRIEIGAKYNLLTCIEDCGTTKQRRIFRFLCDCGNPYVGVGWAVKNGHVKSCGCLKTKHGESRFGGAGDKKSPEYVAWLAMRERCRRKTHWGYKYYGGKGIGITSDWDNFHAFLSDMGRKPNGDYSLDRIDNARGYSKNNCRWATREEQNRNKSAPKLQRTNVSGVFVSSRTGKFFTRLSFSGSKRWVARLGEFDTESEAAVAVQNARYLAENT